MISENMIVGTSGQEAIERAMSLQSLAFSSIIRIPGASYSKVSQKTCLGQTYRSHRCCLCVVLVSLLSGMSRWIEMIGALT